jgi:hypothetical protein
MRQTVHPSALPADPRGSALLTDPRATKLAAIGVEDRTSLPADPETQRERALHLYAKGMEQIERGNVLAARSFFALAAKAGLKRSLRALAGTYDPVQLDKLKVLGMQPNAEVARSWYEKAGDLDATTRLDLGAEWGMSATDKSSSRKKRDSVSIARETSRD